MINPSVMMDQFAAQDARIAGLVVELSALRIAITQALPLIQTLRESSPWEPEGIQEAIARMEAAVALVPGQS